MLKYSVTALATLILSPALHAEEYTQAFQASLYDGCDCNLMLFEPAMGILQSVDIYAYGNAGMALPLYSWSGADVSYSVDIYGFIGPASLEFSGSSTAHISPDEFGSVGAFGDASSYNNLTGNLSQFIGTGNISLDYGFYFSDNLQVLSGDVDVLDCHACFDGEMTAVIVYNYDLPAAVPEPASWAMMVGGFGLLGGALRRRRASITFA